MNNIPTQFESPKGLHQRYYIQKIVKTDGSFLGLQEDKLELHPVDKDAEYFVLRLDDGGSDPKHIEACRIAVNAYADAIKDHLPELAKDLKERYPMANETLTAKHLGAINDDAYWTKDKDFILPFPLSEAHTKISLEAMLAVLEYCNEAKTSAGVVVRVWSKIKELKKQNP